MSDLPAYFLAIDRPYAQIFVFKALGSLFLSFLCIGASFWGNWSLVEKYKYDVNLLTASQLISLSAWTLYCAWFAIFVTTDVHTTVSVCTHITNFFDILGMAVILIYTAISIRRVSKILLRQQETSKFNYIVIGALFVIAVFFQVLEMAVGDDKRGNFYCSPVDSNANAQAFTLSILAVACNAAIAYRLWLDQTELDGKRSRWDEICVSIMLILFAIPHSITVLGVASVLHPYVDLTKFILAWLSTPMLFLIHNSPWLSFFAVFLVVVVIDDYRVAFVNAIGKGCDIMRAILQPSPPIESHDLGSV